LNYNGRPPLWAGFFMSTPDQSSVPNVALIVGILVLASSTSIMSTDMYTPSLPDLTEIFSTTPEMVKLTISLNMLAFGLAQFFYGPISDRFGRKPVMLVSISLVAVLCLCCAMATSIEQLIVFRVLLGLAAAAEAVLGLAIIKDLFDEKRQMKVLASLNMVIALAPAIAPILGGFIHVRYGWTMNFYFLVVMALLSLTVTFIWLPESHTPDTTALQPRKIVVGYTRLFFNSEFIVHTVLCSLSLGLIFVFVTGAPFVLIELLEVPVQHFGFYSATIVLAFFLGSMLASKLVDSINTQLLLQAGVSFILLGSVLLVLLILFFDLSPVAISACYAIMTFGMAGVFAVAPSRALRSVTTQTGSASAMLSGVEQTLAGIAAVAVSVFHDGSARPMAWITVVLAILLVPLLKWSNASDAKKSHAV